jgi:pilus assembly protein CpaC
MMDFYHMTIGNLLRSVCLAAAVLAAIPLSAHADGQTLSDDARFEQQTKDILQSLQVNADPTASIQPVHDEAIVLRAGESQIVAMPIGSARMVHVEGAFTAATVVTPDVADINIINHSMVQVVARKEGSTDIVFVSASGAEYKAHLVVAANAGPVQAALNVALPHSGIVASAVNGAIMLSGSTADATTADTAMLIARRFVADQVSGVVNNIQILGVQQVMLRVHVAEVNRTVIKDLGLNTAIGTFNGGTVIGNLPNLANGLNTTAGAAALAEQTNPVAYFSSKAFGTQFTTVANALESQGLVRTLSEPTLVTESGKTATMLAGAQYPIPSISQSGVTGTSYQNFGVSLSFTPTVNSSNNIGLDIATEVSSLAQNVSFPNGTGGSFNVPVFDTRKASTSVELPSGGSIVIAGLISNDFQNTVAGIPGLKDIPILGKLFSSAAFQRDETELVISVTAYLVEPTDAANIQDPTAGLQPPSDSDLYLLNRLTGASGRQLSTPPGVAVSDFGYITE